MRPQARIESIRARAFTIPTDAPEADGTLEWDSTTLVVTHVAGGGETGLGYTYAHACVTGLIGQLLAKAVTDMDCLDPPAAAAAMRRAVRNLGQEGLAAMAISAVDVALWDLKAKLLGLPLASLLGRRRERVPIYGSGGFTSYTDARLAKQLGGWVAEDGCRWVKMKVGTEPARDPERVRAARRTIGEAGLFVDANGAYRPKQALALAERFGEQGVTWFEEPVSSDDLPGLHLVRRRLAAPMEVAAGEYAFTTDYARRMLGAEAVDVMQADATRCGGVTGFLAIAELCQARHIDLSAHCAPALHLSVCCAAPRVRHQEWFHDHVRIEHMLFDGAPTPRDGLIAPDLERPGLGLVFKAADAERYGV